MPRERRTSRVKPKRAGSWVRRVQETSNAMDLPSGIFKRSPAQIARGLRQSVLRSRRTKGTKFQSAMSMLNLYINRYRKRLEAAKDELRRVFGRESGGRGRQGGPASAGRPALGPHLQDEGRSLSAGCAPRRRPT